MSKLYTFVVPFSGTMSVWLEAESEEEARQNVLDGNWWDSNEESFESHPEKGMVLVQVEEITEEEIEE
jgi:hypothetical protein